MSAHLHSCRVMILIGLGLLLGAAAGCGSNDATANPGAPGRTKRPVPVSAEPVKRGVLRLKAELVGEVKARRSVDVAVETTGKLLEVLVDLGDEVTKGQLLAKLDTTKLRAQLAEAQAAHAASQAAIQRAEAEFDSASSDFARREPLARDNLVTPQEMDQARAKRDSAQAGLRLARAQSTQAGASIRILRQQLADATVKAPFDGRVQERLLDPGAIVKAGSPILRLVHTNPAVVTFQVSEHWVGRLRQRVPTDGGTEPLDVELTLPAYPGKRWTGKLVRLAPALDPETRAATAEAEYENRSGDLMPGMFCRVSIDLGGRDDALLVPLGALIGRSKGTSRSSVVGKQRGDSAVFIVREGKANRVAIKLGVERGGYGEVLDGLAEGDQVVTEGQVALQDGRAVRVIKAKKRD